jgi:hypothetical protein|tara:strand:+ start:854 stop:1159 length:306 start_codon:yes stop_codon:yes gene_type:complete
MNIRNYKFTNGDSIQVGSCTNASTATATAVAVTGIVEIQDVSGGGGFIAFGDSSVSAPSADAAGAIYIPPFGITRPISIPTGVTHVISSSGFKINVRSLGS